MGFTSEIEAAYTSFCLMYGLGAHSSAGPEGGGFARTDVARRNFARTRPWLAKQGLCDEPDLSGGIKRFRTEGTMPWFRPKDS
jgi:hypothetical protein